VAAHASDVNRESREDQGQLMAACVFSWGFLIHKMPVQQQWHEATKYRQAKQLLRRANLSFTKYALRLSRADLRILTGLLTGHAD